MPLLFLFSTTKRCGLLIGTIQQVTNYWRSSGIRKASKAEWGADDLTGMADSSQTIVQAEQSSIATMIVATEKTGR
ncbi:MAG: hypothetical protein L0Y39_08405 [Methylococcaceae bacterium]|nr:hypothetical protein [Methylococcaceae bacterium]